jgi:hypothetical protein
VTALAEAVFFAWLGRLSAVRCLREKCGSGVRFPRFQLRAPAPKTGPPRLEPLLVFPTMEKKPRIFTMTFGSVYPLYVAKAVKKGRTKEEVDAIIAWLTGYEGEGLQRVIDDKTDFETFFAEAPALNPNVDKITGLVCGVRVEEVADPLMRNIRYLDKLVDELARGKKLASILRA